MSDSRDGMEQRKAHAQVDKGYGQKKHLIDRLRYDESIEDFRSIRNAILHSNEFSVGNRSFRFAEVVIQKNKD